MSAKPQFRETLQRKVILEELRRIDSHPGADEIFERVRRRLPRISLATVYRNLDTLAEMGQIQRLEVGGTLKRFDPITAPHYHIRCMCCDRIVDAPLEILQSLEAELKARTEFKIVGHHLEFVGLCPECAAGPMAPGLRSLSPPGRRRTKSQEKE